MIWHIGQRVRVYPNTLLLWRITGYAGTIYSIEMEDDIWIYRVRLDTVHGEGYPFYAHELKADCPTWQSEISAD